MNKEKKNFNQARSKEWVIPGTLGEAQKWEQELQNFLDSLDLTGEDSFKFILSVHEALINVITHKTKLDPDKKIEIGAIYDGKRVIVTIFDFLPIFDYSKIKSRDLKNIKPHGLGVYFYTTFSDDVEYYFHQQKGNAIRLIKNWNA